MPESLIKRLSRTPQLIVPISPDAPIIRRWATPFEHGEIEIMKSGHSVRDIRGSRRGVHQVEVTLAHYDTRAQYLVTFEAALSLRLLGPGDALNYWEARAGIPISEPEKTANSFAVDNAPWPKESPLLWRAVESGGAIHYAIADDDRIVEVICESVPRVREID